MQGLCNENIKSCGRCGNFSVKVKGKGACKVRSDEGAGGGNYYNR